MATPVAGRSRGVPDHASPVELVKRLRAEKDPVASLSLLDVFTADNPSFSPSTPILLPILRGLCSSTAATRYLPFLLHILRRLSRRPRFTENDALLALKAFSRALMPDHALRTLQDLPQTFRCKPGVRSYNAMLDALVRARSWEKAEYFFAHFTSQASVCPNTQTFNILIRGLCSRDQHDRAVHLLESMRCHGLIPNHITYSTLISFYVRKGNFDTALNLFDKMIDMNVVPDAVCYNVLIDGFFKERDFSNGIRIWEMLLRDTSVKPNLVTYNVMLNGYCKHGKFDEGIEVWNHMLINGHRPDLFTYAALIRGLCEMANLTSAFFVFCDMIHSGFVPDAVVCNVLLNGFFKAKKMEECYVLWGWMERAGKCSTASYNILIRYFSENKRLDEVASIWKCNPRDGGSFIPDSSVIES